MIFKKILQNKKIVLGVSGGIAAYKSVSLLRNLIKSGAEVQVVVTANSLNFIGKSTWETLSGKELLFDVFQTVDPSKITHITLAQEADAIVVAPATADIIAKAACGIADDLLSTVLAAATIPVILAPSMNGAMYENPSNINNLNILKARKNFYFIGPETGELACKTVGIGKMASEQKIIAKLETIFYPEKFPGLNWLITGGATREYLDPIRFLTSGSSGKTALALADAAFKSGGNVALIGANIEPQFNLGYSFIKTETAAETAAQVEKRVKEADVFIMSAAIADYSPIKKSQKIKKGENSISIQLFKSADILLESAKWAKSSCVRVGFAAETDNLELNAKKKLKEKNLDLIVANLVSPAFTPFGSDYNSVKLITAASEEEFCEIKKSDLAQTIIRYAIDISRGKR